MIFQQILYSFEKSKKQLRKTAAFYEIYYLRIPSLAIIER